ncbi:MAG: type II toxin-antitoxin system RatA family toxin [Halothiobacillaceae bacterium]|nr:type II toxin-antitoxin system RatA family toxin [Halothiobacillaceae bacterium]
MSTTIEREVDVPFTALQMYALVSDIDAYPDFLPWCEQTRILSTSGDEVEASITLRKGAIRKSFVTRNHNEPGSRIVVTLVDGPFRHLDGYWAFENLPDGGSRVTLDMRFEFANRFLEAAIGPVFREIVKSLVGAFRKRAFEVYPREDGA